MIVTKPTKSKILWSRKFSRMRVSESLAHNSLDFLGIAKQFKANLKDLRAKANQRFACDRKSKDFLHIENPKDFQSIEELFVVGYLVKNQQY